MGKRAPSAPSPERTAAAQTGSNFMTAVTNGIMGQVNQTTPYGSVNYRTSGYQAVTDPSNGQVYQVPIREAVQTYTPSGQRIVDATMATQENLANLGRDQSSRIGGLLSRPIDMSGLPGARTSVTGDRQQMVGSGPQLATTYGTDWSQDRQRVEQTLMQRMQPGLDQDRASLRQQLADQGIQYGSAAYQAAMADQNRQVNDARMGAVLAGGQEQSRLAGMEADRAAFGNTARQQMFANTAAGTAANNASRAANFQQDMQAAQFQNQARQQALQERYAQRNQPLNEIAALMSGSQVQSPNFMNISGPQMANTDVAGITQAGFQNQMAQWQANQGIMGGIMGGVGNLLMLSDRRAKEDVKKVGKTNDGQPIYTYRYKGGGPIQMGLMAQDVKKRRPDAVKTLPGGLMAVDYGRATRGDRK